MRQIIATLVILLTYSSLQAQKLQGRIVDYQKQPIENAIVFLKSQNKHTHTNEQGYFSFENAKLGDSLQISHLNFESKIWVVNELENIYVKLNPKPISLKEVIVLPNINALNILSDVDIQVQPVNSSQEILRQVPGLFIGQHAGGGKAEQIFLRGFDIDHGTDISISVDGMPVNMVSHAHGQGYSDLHFVIPETIDKIDFGKGPYNADVGNFATAGYIGFKTKDRLEQNIISLEGGMFNSQRMATMLSLVKNDNHSAYVAGEFIATDGPFDSPQHFKRANVMAKYHGTVNGSDRVTALVAHFSSSWDASGQIPMRAVQNGSISRFGAIDDTEGGNTSRSNLMLKYDKVLDKKSFISTSIYGIHYDFELYSNFTFFLNDPINGDQFRQKEDRIIYGFQSVLNHQFQWGQLGGDMQAGVGLRHDEVSDSELSWTTNRIETRDSVMLGDIKESNISAFYNLNFDWGKWVINPSVRLDHFNFQYYDRLIPLYRNQQKASTIISPKLNILYNANARLQFYLKSGKGFHSNDTRVVINEAVRKTIPVAWGADLGVIWKPIPSMVINTALWNLYMEQEFVYVGDEGVVEPSGRSNRQGVDLSVRYQPISWLFWNFDTNYTLARSIDEDEGANFIPLAPDFTIVSGLQAKHPLGVYGGMNVRYMKDRPAKEDNSIVAKGYSVVDMNFGYQWRAFDFSIHIQNLFDTEWEETQFATESRLIGETEAIEEIHFTPGTPFFLRAKLAFRF